MLEVVSGKPYNASEINVINREWSRDTEVSNMLEFDVGIMPLTEDEWARGKSGNKAIYYMALGIPAVVSPVGCNADIVVDGETGYHAGTRGEWVDRLARLILNPDLRHEMGRRARQRVIDYYSKEVAVRELTAVLLSAIESHGRKP